jgi:hypothetical protein
VDLDRRGRQRVPQQDRDEDVARMTELGAGSSLVL